MVRFIQDKVEGFCGLNTLSSIKKDQNNFWNENSVKNISTNARLLDGINRTGISDHGDFSFDSIENKVTRTMKGGFYFTIAYNKE